LESRADFFFAKVGLQKWEKYVRITLVVLCAWCAEGKMLMSTWQIIGGILIILLCAVSVILVMLQKPTSRGLTALTGGDSYYSKHQERSKDAWLFKGTKYTAILLFAATIIVYAFSR